MNCESRGLITVRRKNGTVYCRSPPRKKKSASENVDVKEFMMSQTVVGLRSYIIARDRNRVLTGWSKLKKIELVDFIIKHIDVDTGKLKQPTISPFLQKQDIFNGYVVPNTDQGFIPGTTEKTFKFSIGTAMFVDVLQDLSKNSLSSLQTVGKFLMSKGFDIPGMYKLRKAELVKHIQKYLKFE